MRNLTRFERIWRWSLGIILLMWAFSGGPTWGYIGLYFLATGSWGFCPVYSILKIKDPSKSSDKNNK